MASCAGCDHIITGEECGITCSTCSCNYDLLCAGLTLERYSSLTENNQAWICINCRSKLPKIGDVNTPIRDLLNKSSVEKMCDNSINDSILEFSKVTVRRPQQNTARTITSALVKSSDPSQGDCKCCDLRAIIREELETMLREPLAQIENIRSTLNTQSLNMKKIDWAHNSILKKLDKLLNVPDNSVSTNIQSTKAPTGRHASTFDPFLAATSSVTSNSDLTDKSQKPSEQSFAGAVAGQKKKKVRKTSGSYIALPPSSLQNTPRPETVPSELNSTSNPTLQVEKSRHIKLSEPDRPLVTSDIRLFPGDEVEHANEQWTEVRRKKPRTSFSVRGTAGPETTSLKAVEFRRYLHLWNMLSGADEVRIYLQHLCPEGSCTVEELKPRGDYKSFKVGIPPAYYDKCLCADVWPENARIKRWLFRGSQINENPHTRS